MVTSPKKEIQNKGKKKPPIKRLNVSRGWAEESAARAARFAAIGQIPKGQM